MADETPKKICMMPGTLLGRLGAHKTARVGAMTSSAVQHEDFFDACMTFYVQKYCKRTS